MLTQAIVQSSVPMVLDIESVDPDEILILKSISGLSSPGVTLYLGEFAREGGYYQGRRAKPLTPVFNFKINPSYANDIEASDVREILYRTFMNPLPDSDGVQVTVKDDRKPDRYFIGYAEGIEADMFEKELTGMISMVCNEGYLYSTAETTGSNAGGWFVSPIIYDGSADTGLEMTFKVLATASQITIKNNTEEMILDGSFVINDIISINTSEGFRHIKRNGVDIMVSFRAGSDWIYLKQAVNAMTIFGAVANDGKVVMTSYKYRSKWWGI